MLQRAAAPDDAEQHVEMAPVVGVDDVADADMAEDDDPGDHQKRLPGPILQQLRKPI